MWPGIAELIYIASGLVFLATLARRRRWLIGLGVLLGVAAFGVHTACMVRMGLQTGRPPLTNTHETLLLLGWLLVVVCAVTLWICREPGLGALGAFGGALAVAGSSLFSPSQTPLLPSLRSNWLLFHVLSAFLGYAAFALACGAAILFLSLWLYRKGSKTRQPWAAKTMESLDFLAYRLIAFGFPLLTMGIATGSAWAAQCWGRYWNWDPKETSSFVTWLVYAAYLHMRQSRNMRGGAAALAAVGGFLLVLFTYLGVNCWLETVHDYAGGPTGRAWLQLNVRHS